MGYYKYPERNNIRTRHYVPDGRCYGYIQVSYGDAAALYVGVGSGASHILIALGHILIADGYCGILDMLYKLMEIML